MQAAELPGGCVQTVPGGAQVQRKPADFLYVCIYISASGALESGTQRGNSKRPRWVRPRRVAGARACAAPGTHSAVCGRTCMVEMGRYPMQIQWLTRTLRYWNKLDGWA